MRSYGKGRAELGTKTLVFTEKWWRKSMKKCAEVNSLFDEIVATAYTLSETVGFEDTLRNNYDAQKGIIDEQWKLMLDSWYSGSYFNAGMH